ncbi:hypothetical protein Moror_3515, partial [Moniliophthora roreri MCA 2997]
CDEALPICKNCRRRELFCVPRPTNKHELRHSNENQRSINPSHRLYPHPSPWMPPLSKWFNISST